MTQAQPSLSEDPRRRLHPLSPLLRSGRLVALAIAAISWRGYQELGTQDWLLAVGGLMLLVLLGSVVSWAVTGYHVVGRELRVYEGLLWRRTRAIPLERLQSVELVQPLLARAAGLAELRLEVVGADKTEAPLAFLTVADATELRERLLTVAGRAHATDVLAAGAPSTAVPSPAAPSTGAPSTAAPSTWPAEGQPAGAPAGPGVSTADGRPSSMPERLVHVLDNQTLIISQLLRPQLWLIPLGVATPIFFFAQENDLGFIAIASMLTATVGAVLAPIRSVTTDWGFTVATAQDGLRVRRGLVERRSQTVPAGRIQSIAVSWPLLWRMLGWVRVSMHVAGVGGRREQVEAGASLLPVGTVPTAEQVIGEVLPGFVLRTISVYPIPRRARWLAPLRWRVLGYQLTSDSFVARHGLVTRQLVVVPYARIQSVRLRQGPVQRLLGLASVYVDTAAGGGAAAPHRDVAEARALATELADRSRRARSNHP